MANKLLLATPTNPEMLSKFFNEKSEIIEKVSIISVDYAPFEIYNDKIKAKNSKSNQSVFNKKNDQAVMFDVVGLIVDVSSLNKKPKSLNNTKNSENDADKKMFILAKEVMFISYGDEKLISINGDFDVLPDELISKIYTNFSDLKSIDLSELEDILELSKDETAIKAFYKLGSYFTAKKYEINNNIFSLIEHQEQAESVSKKVLLKKMVAWEIRK